MNIKLLPVKFLSEVFCRTYIQVPQGVVWIELALYENQYYGFVNTVMYHNLQIANKSIKCDRSVQNNIKMDMREIRQEVFDWINVVWDKNKWRAVVNAVMNLRIA